MCPYRLYLVLNSCVCFRAVIVYDNVYQRIIQMAVTDSAAAAEVGIPSVFVTREAGRYMISYHSQVVSLSRKDSLHIGAPFFILSWMLLMCLIFAIFLGIGVTVQRLCCCTNRNYVINRGIHEPSEDVSYELMEADSSDDSEDKESIPFEQETMTIDEEEEDDDEEAVRFGKEEDLNGSFLVSV